MGFIFFFRFLNELIWTILYELSYTTGRGAKIIFFIYTQNKPTPCSSLGYLLDSYSPKQEPGEKY